MYTDTENIKLVFCAVKDTIMQSALKEFNLAWTGTGYYCIYLNARRGFFLLNLVLKYVKSS